MHPTCNPSGMAINRRFCAFQTRAVKKLLETFQGDFEGAWRGSEAAGGTKWSEPQRALRVSIFKMEKIVPGWRI